MTRIVVVGGGAAGIGAAWSLVKAGFQVTLIEAEHTLGGHCLAAAVPLPNGDSALIDVGVSDFNRATFTNVGALFDELALKHRPINQDASFVRPDGSTAWYTNAGEIHLSEPLVDEQRFRAEIARFRLECLEVLDDPTFRDFTLRQYVDDRNYGREFRELYLYPRAQGSFPMPDKDPASYQVRGLVAFWRMHGIAGPGPADRRVLEGGMHSYGTAFARWFRQHGGTIFLGAEVVGIARRPDGIRVRFVDAGRQHQTLSFDHVVLATGSLQVIPLLEDATEEEKQAYEGFSWQRARVVVHRDPRLMPERRAAWGAYNYVIGEDGVPEIRPTITFYPNKLAGLSQDTPDVFVSVNPFREPASDKVLQNQFFLHPAAGASTDLACARVDQLQGKRNTWFCGSYLTRPWVHEQALTSGLELSNRLRHRLLVTPKLEDVTHVDDFLRTIPIFEGLDTSVLADVQMVANVFSAPAGKVLFRQNDEADGMYLIARGRIRVSTRAPGDDEVDLVEIGPGGLLGEFSLLDGGRRSAMAVAAEASGGFHVSLRRFESLRRDSRPSAFEVIDRIRAEVARRARTLTAAIAAEPIVAGITTLRPPGLEEPGARPAAVLSDAAQLDIVLAEFPSFADFSAEEIRLFLAMCQRVDAPRGALLAERGQRPECLFVVVRGAVRSSIGRDARLEQLSIHGPGDLVGTLALMDGGPMPVELEVREEAILLRLERRNFEALRKGYSEVGYKLFDQINLQLVRDLRRLIRHLARLRGIQRFNQQQRT